MSERKVLRFKKNSSIILVHTSVKVSEIDIDEYYSFIESAFKDTNDIKYNIYFIEKPDRVGAKIFIESNKYMSYKEIRDKIISINPKSYINIESISEEEMKKREDNLKKNLELSTPIQVGEISF